MALFLLQIFSKLNILFYNSVCFQVLWRREPDTLMQTYQGSPSQSLPFVNIHSRTQLTTSNSQVSNTNSQSIKWWICIVVWVQINDKCTQLFIGQRRSLMCINNKANCVTEDYYIYIQITDVIVALWYYYIMTLTCQVQIQFLNWFHCQSHYLQITQSKVLIPGIWRRLCDPCMWMCMFVFMGVCVCVYLNCIKTPSAN